MLNKILKKDVAKPSDILSRLDILALVKDMDLSKIYARQLRDDPFAFYSDVRMNQLLDDNEEFVETLFTKLTQFYGLLGHK